MSIYKYYCFLMLLTDSINGKMIMALIAGRHIYVLQSPRGVFQKKYQGISKWIMKSFFPENNSAENKQHERCCGIHAAMRVLAESSTPDEAISKILQTICESLEWTLGEFWTADSKNNVLRCTEIWHKPSVNISEYHTLTRQILFFTWGGTAWHGLS